MPIKFNKSQQVLKLALKNVLYFNNSDFWLLGWLPLYFFSTFLQFFNIFQLNKFRQFRFLALRQILTLILIFFSLINFVNSEIRPLASEPGSFIIYITRAQPKIFANSINLQALRLFCILALLYIIDIFIGCFFINYVSPIK